MNYTVRAGDTLSLIAQHELGDAAQWPQIYAANKRQMDTAWARVGDAFRQLGVSHIQHAWDYLIPGQSLRLPD